MLIGFIGDVQGQGGHPVAAVTPWQQEWSWQRPSVQGTDARGTSRSELG